MFVSYAQNFEDVMLWRALKHVEKGFYIDIGAQDPVIDSVSFAFYEHGWRGVHVEPVSYYADKLRLARPDETVIQAAVARKSGVLSFFEIDATGLSTGDARIAEKHRAAGFNVRETVVSCLPLFEILGRYQDRDIHWMKIDVEGMEAEVLQGWPPSEVRPWIVVIESTLPNTQVETHGEWEPLLFELGYEFVYFDGLNRFYVSKFHQELKEHFRYPPNFFDNFALSGTSGGFCVLLNNKLAQREQEFTAQLQRSREETQRLVDTLTEREREIGELQTRAEWLKGEWEAARGGLEAANKRIHELELSLAQREAVRQELQAQVEWLKDEWKDARGDLEAANKRIHELELSLAQQEAVRQELQTQAEWLKGDWKEVKGDLDAANKRIHELELSLAQQEAAHLELQNRAEWLNNEWNAAKAKIDELNGHAHHWWTVADELNRELQAVYASRSWRLTKPLRWMNQHFKKISGGIKSLMLCAAGLPRRLVRRLLEAGLDHVRRNPGHKDRLKRLLARWPRLQARLYAFAAARSTPPVAEPSSSPVSAHDSKLDLNGYPVSVRTAYLQLTSALDRAGQSREEEGRL